MKDQITLDRIKLLHPKVRDEAFEIHNEINERFNGRVLYRYSQTLRSFAEQDAIYAQGRTKVGDIVSYAKGGQSFHNYGLATDGVLLLDKDGNGTFETIEWDFFKDSDKDGLVDMDEIDFVFKSYGWEYLINAKGKRWDFPHRQKTFGFNVRQLLAMYDAKKFIPNTNYLLL